MVKVLLISVFLFWLSGALASEKNCVPRSEMAKIARHFTQFRELARSQYCYNGSQTSHLIAGIMFMRKTQFAPEMPESRDQLFSRRFASNWYNYFIGRIESFSVPSSCARGVGAYVYSWGDRTMYVCPYLLSESFTAMDRASVFMHEARHIDGYPHTTCRRGARAGIRGACDRRITEGGSYAVTVETYAQIGRYARDIHPAMAAYARASAVTYADETFDTPANVRRDHHFLLVTEDQKIYLADIEGSQITTQQMGEASELGVIARRAEHMVLIPNDRKASLKYFFTNNAGELNQQAGLWTEDYNLKPESYKKQVRGIHVAGQWHALVRNTKVDFECGIRNPNRTTINMPRRDTAVSIIYPEGYSRASQSAHIATASGTIYRFGCRGSRPFVERSNLSFDREFVRVVKSGRQTVGLTSRGELFSITPGGSSVAIDSSINGKVVEMTYHQTWEFFDSDEG